MMMVVITMMVVMTILTTMMTIQLTTAITMMTMMILKITRFGDRAASIDTLRWLTSSNCAIVIHTDANWAGCPPIRKSYSYCGIHMGYTWITRVTHGLHLGVTQV